MSALIRQFSIRTRMIGAIAMVLALLLMVGGVGFMGMNTLRDHNRQIVENSATLVKQASALAQHLESGAAKEGGAQQEKLLSEIKSTLKQSADVAQAHGKGAQDNSLMTFIIVLSLGAIIVVPLTLLNMQSICTPLAQADALANAIANGDLTGSSAAIEGQDEASHLMRSLQNMQQALQGLVSQLRTSADSIRTASVEIASGNQDLSNRTEQTASNLQQAASSMVQLTGTVRQTADSARTANQLATSASHAAAKGGEVVGQVVSTMDDINTSSKKISDIIGVIDSIAFQTNILALNAAVEAARAGEQGRGFAVVASEVRSLAQRSAEAAREIKTLIGASVERVEVGSRLVQEAGSSMTDIVSSVQRVSDIIGEITAAASEQSDGIEQVNQSVVQLDQMTQQNAALVEESAAAAESLKDQAESLAEAVGKFRTSTEVRPQHRAAKTGMKTPVKTAPAKAAPMPTAKKAAMNSPSPAPRPAAAPVSAAPAPKAKAPAPSSQSESEWESF
ncbi:methyl-accepting chemotaxis protein [Paucibacter sp. B2R-40]|uniref:methyl-accepting chemotaxis protein n=1 Tax=Paucibacter sp. B2R-40 TaxID=2893554 RepID=UPI0021E4A5C6|nr:methyl-accepting chemotaxis protein [Paucibacter sp. B2R-40]MCV2355192.1 methyl-accepting chemotaxis protein [Paucibacter sp. B2R-40]